MQGKAGDTGIGTAILGTITIGQAPRLDVAPALDAHLPAGLVRRDVGVLDGMTAEQITLRYAPRSRERRFLTRLLDGTAVELDAAAAETGVQQKLHDLEQGGCTVILVLCSGVFRGLRTRRAWLIEPDRILPGLVGGLAGARRVGVVMPLALPIDGERRKWAALQIPAAFAVANPYADGEEQAASAARELQRGGANLLMLDCFGYTERHRLAAAQASGLPVLLSSELMGRVTGACLPAA
ncbi:MAG: AroM family protein [Acidobacteriota bacterium]